MREAPWAPRWPCGMEPIILREPQAHGGCRDSMRGALLGPAFSETKSNRVLSGHHAVYERLDDEQLIRRTVELLAQEKVVGWVQGRMEFGPRALGNRSILGDARSPRMQSMMNLKVKFRESFRPFAPVVRRERVADYFELEVESPYMLLVAPVKPTSAPPRSGIRPGPRAAPAHSVDYSSRDPRRLFGANSDRLARAESPALCLAGGIRTERPDAECW